LTSGGIIFGIGISGWFISVFEMLTRDFLLKNWAPLGEAAEKVLVFIGIYSL